MTQCVRKGHTERKVEDSESSNDHRVHVRARAYERIITIVITSYPIVRDRGDLIFVSSPIGRERIWVIRLSDGDLDLDRWFSFMKNAASPDRNILGICFVYTLSIRRFPRN